MIYYSTDSENLKRKKVRRDIGAIACGYETTPILEIDKLIAKSPVTKDKILCHESGGDYDDNKRLVFYYEEDETDDEYNKRIASLELQDIKDFRDVLARYSLAVTKKKELKVLLDKVLKKNAGIIPDWQKDQVENFFGYKTYEEYFQEGYKKGLKEGIQEIEELRKAIREL